MDARLANWRAGRLAVRIGRTAIGTVSHWGTDHVPPAPREVCAVRRVRTLPPRNAASWMHTSERGVRQRSVSE
jgi:hypothetical protein